MKRLTAILFFCLCVNAFAIDGWLKQSTSKTVMIGPFLDDVDGITAETGLTISQADVRLSKSDTAFAQKNESTSCTHDENGWYTCPLDTTDTGTLGFLKLHVVESGAGPVTITYMVVPANIYDSLIAGTDKQQVDQVEVEGTDATTYIEGRTLAAADYFLFGTDPVELLDSGGSAGTSAAELVDGVFDEVVEAGYSFRQCMRIAMAWMAGDLVIAGSTYTYMGLDGVTERIVGTATSGGRSIGSLDGD